MSENEFQLVLAAFLTGLLGYLLARGSSAASPLNWLGNIVLVAAIVFGVVQVTLAVV